MSRTALALVLLAASGSVASAGTYVGLGIGTSPATSGDLTLREDGRSGRVQLGYSFGKLAVEGFVARADIYRDDYAQMKWTTVGAAGKLNFPLGFNFEAFGRAGVQHTSISQVDYDDSFSGNGILIGGGFEYKLDLTVTSGAIFVDYTLENTTTTRSNSSMEAGVTSRVWTLGAIVSL